MQANANSKTEHKFWSCKVSRIGQLYLEVHFHRDRTVLSCSTNISGASPAYVEALIEEKNIHMNEMMYNLGRIVV